MSNLFAPHGLTNVKPCGKSQVSWVDFHVGVSTTKSVRGRAGGANRANPSSRDTRTVVPSTHGDGMSNMSNTAGSHQE